MIVTQVKHKGRLLDLRIDIDPNANTRGADFTLSLYDPDNHKVLTEKTVSAKTLMRKVFT